MSVSAVLANERHTFWDTMPPWMQAEVENIAALRPRPTGSRLFCPAHVRTDSDWDVYFMASDEWIESQDHLGTPGSPVGVDGVVSLKRSSGGKTLNLIAFTANHEFFWFECATAVCRALRGPIKKPGRIIVFERVRHERWTLKDLTPSYQVGDWLEPGDLAVAADWFYEAGFDLIGDFLREPDVWEPSK